MPKPKTSRARLAALQWFDQHEKEPPHELLFKAKPSTKMRRLMLREGQLAAIEVGQFGAQRWVLTFAGREALAKMKARQRHGERP